MGGHFQVEARCMCLYDLQKAFDSVEYPVNCLRLDEWEDVEALEELV